SQEPSSHPAARRLAAWGDPILISADAEHEVRSPRLKSGGWRLTEKYLIRTTFFTFDLHRFDDLLWSYKKVTQHRVNFIPTGKTYQAAFVCQGGTALVSGSQKNVDALLAYAAERAPWALTGFTPELDQLFKKQNAQFRAAVDQRKRECLQRTR